MVVWQVHGAAVRSSAGVGGLGGVEAQAARSKETAAVASNRLILVSIRPKCLSGMTRSQFLRNEEGEFKSLLVVEPWIAVSVVARGKIRRGQLLRAAGAFRHILAGHFKVHAARMGPLALDDIDEVADLGEDALERTRLVFAFHFHVAVHGIGRPYDGAAFLDDAADELGQAALHLVRT